MIIFNKIKAINDETKEQINNNKKNIDEKIAGNEKNINIFDNGLSKSKMEKSIVFNSFFNNLILLLAHVLFILSIEFLTLFKILIYLFYFQFYYLQFYLHAHLVYFPVYFLKNLN